MAFVSCLRDPNRKADNFCRPLAQVRLRDADALVEKPWSKPMQVQCETTTDDALPELAVAVSTKEVARAVVTSSRSVAADVTPLTKVGEGAPVRVEAPPPRPAVPPPVREPNLVETIVGLLRLLPGKTVATGFADHQLGLTLKLDAETMATLEPYLQVGSDYTPFARPVAASATETPINAHILIVEDTLVSRLMLRRTLEQIPGCTVSETSTGREALAFMQKNGPPDLCISDIAMPDMDGLTLLKEIRANPSLSHLEVMLCTASTERETILRAVELNVTRYLVKPFEPAQVKTQVRETLVQAAAREFRKLEELQQRVGLDPAGTVEVLRGLSQQLGKDVSAVRNALASGKRHGANMILQGLRGSCSSIKEHALVTRIDNLLVELDRGDLTATLDGLDLLSSEGKRVGQMADKFALVLNSQALARAVGQS
jgi:two-component system chemotaxis response regulator CheY